MKKLISYFSCTGTTEQVAKKIREALKGDIYEIKPENPYTYEDLDWRDPQHRCVVEHNNLDLRPKIKDKVEHIEQYDVIFIGFPIWWGIAPNIIRTFIESYDLSGKVIVPFYTMAGIVEELDKMIKEECPDDAHVVPARRLLPDLNVEDVKAWIKEMNL